MRTAASVVIWVVAAFYLYAAAVHVFNMLSLSGFDSNVPASQQRTGWAY